MKTLEDHNKDVSDARMSRLVLMGADVECGKCHVEMRYTSERNRSIGFGHVCCPTCGAKGYKDAP